MTDRIITVFGAPMLGLPSPLSTFIIPALKTLGIEIVTVNRADPINFAALSDVDRAYFVSHSHGSEWAEMMLGRVGDLWYAEAGSGRKIGWSSIDGVRFTDDETSEIVDPQFLPQTKDLPFIVPSVVNTCRAYHRRLPMDRASANPLRIIVNFPSNSLFQPSVAGQDVTDVELAGTVSDGLALVGSALEGPLGSLVGSVAGSMIDHSLICAAVAGRVAQNVREFFGVE